MICEKRCVIKYFKIEESKKKSKTMEEAEEMKEKGVVQDWPVFFLYFYLYS